MAWLLQILSMQKILITNIYQLYQFHSQFISKGRSKVCIIFVFKKNSKIVAIIKFKYYMTYIGIFEGNVGHFCH